MLEAATPVASAPRFVFWRGAGIGLVAGIPVLALTLFGLSRLGIGNGKSSLIEVLVTTAVFAGLPAILTAGGVARVAVRAALARAAHARRSGVIAAAIRFAVAGVGLAVLGAVPLGGLPMRPLAWSWLGLAGAIAGAATGVLIGLGVQPVSRNRAPTVSRAPVTNDPDAAAEPDATNT